MDAELLQLVSRLATAQHGVITRRQALACGVSRHAIAHALDSGRWRTVLPATYVVGTAPLAGITWASAAVLYAGPTAALARASAAALRGLLEWPLIVEVVHDRRTRFEHPRLRLLWTRSLEESDIVVVDGIRATTPLRTLLDIADDLREVDLADLTAKALRRKLIDRPALERALAEAPHDPYTKALREMTLTPGTADSGVEVVLANALRKLGLDVEINASVFMAGGYWRRGDIVIRRAGVVVQVDSIAFHTGVRAEEDMRRDADWAAAGYRTIRASPRRIRREVQQLAHEIADLCSMPSGPVLTGLQGIKWA